MRGPLPLSDTDLANVRANVLAKIAQRRRTPWGELAALAASGVVAVLSFVMVRQPIVMAPPSSAASRHLLPLTREKEEVVAPLPRQRERVARRAG